jgi:hypothetical protein
MLPSKTKHRFYQNENTQNNSENNLHGSFLKIQLCIFKTFCSFALEYKKKADIEGIVSSESGLMLTLVYPGCVGR